MSGYTIKILSHFSVCVPFLANVFFFKKIGAKDRPFSYFVFLVAIADLVSVFAMLFFKKSHIWTPVLNINVLGESLLLTWMYYKWGLFENKAIYRSILFFFVVAWLLETSYLGNLNLPNIYFSDLHDFVGLLLTISMMNRLATVSKDLIYYSPVFAVCIGFIVYHLFDFIGSIFLSVFTASRSFKWGMTIIQDVSVTLMYFSFTIALILMARAHNRRNNKKRITKVMLDNHNYILVGKKGVS